MEDTRKELERLEKELLSEDELPPEILEDDIFLDEELLREVLGEDAEPAFDDPDKIHEPAEPMVYTNFANDYGKDLEMEAEIMEKKKKNEKTIVGLMITASVLCVGIIGILIYWLETFFG